MEFFDRFSLKKSQLSKFKEIRPVGAELKKGDGRTGGERDAY
jgi:hypothetical protein